nr:MAG TPA: hypothetical protein [Bacteriophage sp.]
MRAWTVRGLFFLEKVIFLSRFVKKGCRLYKTAPLFSTIS